MFYKLNSEVNHLPLNPILNLQRKICVHVPVNTQYYSHSKKVAALGFMKSWKIDHLIFT